MKKKLLALFLMSIATAAAAQQVPLAPGAIPQFVNQLPTLEIGTKSTGIQTVYGNTQLTVSMCEFRANMLPPGAVAGYKGTKVWGYVIGNCPNPETLFETYLGPVIVNQRGGKSTDITFVNDLGSAATTGVIAYRTSTDKTLHWADPLMEDCGMGMPPEFGTPCAQNYSGPIPAVPHLHGGEVPPELDGGPDAWFTSDGAKQGPGFYSAGPPGKTVLYKYPNFQEAGPYWFHDHTLGATRLNVYAGLAGGYYIYDPVQGLPANLQPLTEVVPIIMQDRMFDTSGELLFQAGLNGGILWALNPEHPYWSPEFVGDTIAINGKVWPNFNVQAKRYRFLFLNGSNARTYELFLTNRVTKVNGPSLYVIATDGGYLDAPVKIDPNAPKGLPQRLIIMPGERYEIIIDFAGQPAGTQLVLKNVGKTPFPGGATPTGGLDKLMQFTVTGGPAVADTSYDPASGAPLRQGTKVIQRLVNAAAGTVAPGVTISKTRQLTLNEVASALKPPQVNPINGQLTQYPGGPLEVLVNNTKWAGAITEKPDEGATELWEIVNLTADAHPIHLHLVQFQLLNRQAFSSGKYDAAYEAAFAGGAYMPAAGPPKSYDKDANPLSGGKFGGNPNVDPFLANAVKLPLPQEAGWKDTVVTYPGEVTRLVVRWAPTDAPVTTVNPTYPFDPSGFDATTQTFKFNYVWHCHIIDHEDNEMMRPDSVIGIPGATRTYVKGIDY